MHKVFYLEGNVASPIWCIISLYSRRREALAMLLVQQRVSWCCAVPQRRSWFCFTTNRRAGPKTRRRCCAFRTQRAGSTNFLRALFPLSRSFHPTGGAAAAARSFAGAFFAASTGNTSIWGWPAFVYRFISCHRFLRSFAFSALFSTFFFPPPVSRLLW